MKISLNHLIAVLLIGLTAGSMSNAQVIKKAQVGFRFLENPVSAEVVGRGAVGVATTYNSNGIFWNPALISQNDSKVDLSVNHTRGIADINYNALAASVRLGDFGVLGFSLLAMDYGTFYQTMRAANSQGYIETGTFSPTAIAIGTAFSQKVSNRFSYGIHLKYVRQNLGEAWVSTMGDSLGDPNLNPTKRKYEQSTFAIDVGAFYDFHYNGIKFGAVLYNISRELRYENQDFPLPFAVSFGVTVQPLRFLLDNETAKSFVLSFESRHPRDYGEKAKFGLEYHFLDMFTARVGYMSGYDERNWTAGVGVKGEVSGIPLRIDYAFEPFGLFGNVHFISLGAAY